MLCIYVIGHLTILVLLVKLRLTLICLMSFDSYAKIFIVYLLSFLLHNVKKRWQSLDKILFINPIVIESSKFVIYPFRVNLPFTPLFSYWFNQLDLNSLIYLFTHDLLYLHNSLSLLIHLLIFQFSYLFTDLLSYLFKLSYLSVLIHFLT